MDDFITYKGKKELDAIAAWCEDHSDTIEMERRLFVAGANVTDGMFQTTFNDEFERLRRRLETGDLMAELVPESNWKDAKTYMARLVCYIWSNSEVYNSNEKATDYVFRVAREKDRLYADCRFARTLLAKYGKEVSTIRKEAKILHALGTHFKKAKWSCMEKPPTISQLARKSRNDEERQIRREKKGARH